MSNPKDPIPRATLADVVKHATGTDPNAVKTLSLLPGCQDHEHADWQLGPVGVHRDAEAIDRCNWEVVTEAYAAIDPDGNDHEIHHFGHWAVGWIDEVAYRPGSECARLAAEFRERLENYPILDEMRLSMMEHEEGISE